MFKVEFTKNAIEQLKAADKGAALLVLGWIRRNLEDCREPGIYGRLIPDPEKELRRFRCGGFRIIAEITGSRIIVHVIGIGRSGL
ncbi:MAG: type II toxin-antitoxin system RelE/ParE family toxin [Firmicutes bacterium]|nr:type II toxin-antitoxin system RelE/ParE family toxin [Bacillota bacterium]MBQ1888423.1 type II toxin-antitoxin system RelE/ParE family toxin [Bacillota bacterium]MBQ2455307.1 type II toxin-antitoxin system RelE/ParE family toxin [Bacillota bacterium]MBQ4235059.1 type II toxin-antitoxin system RelE/ParE family toxin [Bacillota bacterium]